jgi:hypothetical protein
MDPRIVLKHSKSSKAGQIEEFAIRSGGEITAGRDPSVDVKYDSNRDDLVSRRHLKVTVKSTNPPEFLITDLGSRNGTFVNKQRVSGSMPLRPGDVVQMGAGGPEFEFDLNPRYSDDSARTRTATGLGTADLKPEIPAAPEPPFVVVPVAPPAPKPKSIRTPKPQKSRPALVVAIAAMIVIATMAAGGVMLWHTGIVDRGVAWWRMHKPRAANDIATVNRNSVGLVEVRWKLAEAAAGRQLYHVYAPNQVQGAGKNGTLLVPGAGPQLPVFLLLDSNQIEPVLSMDSGMGRPVRGRSSGSGFASDPNGAVITTRNVAEPWRASYLWPSDDVAGILLYFGADEKLAQAVISAAQFPRWIPGEAKFVLHGSLDKPGNASINVKGKAESLDVTFPALHIKLPGRLTSASDPGDVAMINVDSVQLPVLAPLGTTDSLNAGDPATVISSSEGITRTTVSNERSSRTYVLSAGPTEAAANGAPVLDKQGRVIAVYNVDTDEDLPVPIAFLLTKEAAYR